MSMTARLKKKFYALSNNFEFRYNRMMIGYHSPFVLNDSLNTIFNCLHILVHSTNKMIIEEDNLILD